MPSDVVIRFSGDTAQLDQAFKDAGLNVKILGQKVQQSGAGIRGLGGAITQTAFAAQDFSAILSMGGRNALGRALMSTANNVQMLGAAFGPWGLAISAIGGALASVLIPKLFETDKAFDGISEGIAESTKRLHEFIRSAQDMSDFEIKFAKGDDKSRIGMGEDVAARGRREKINLDMKREQEQALRTRIAAQEGNLARLKASPEWSKMFPWEDGGAAGTEAAIADMKKALRGLTDEILKDEKELSRIGAMDKILGGPDEQRRREAREKLKDVFKERQGVVSSIASAREQFEMAIAKLGDQLTRGVIDDALFDKAATFEADKLAKSFGKPLDSNKAMLSNSAEAQAFINKQARGSPQVDLQKQLLQVAKDQLTEIRRQNATAVGAAL